MWYKVFCPRCHHSLYHSSLVRIPLKEMTSVPEDVFGQKGKILEMNKMKTIFWSLEN